ncbi:bZIP transcription factor [Sporobolomyces salmoneus]|uniref:bZIP transcription factor n=1 Tax=Sporobolomyces salmoneus TaxID=183962 RepID=UPI0031719A37
MSSSRSSTRKRDSSSVISTPSHDDDLDLDAPATKRRAPTRTSASEKAAKKSARMERNRIAAQASRDRKKNHTEYLESRIAELEAQLQQSTNNSISTPSSASPSSLGLPLPPLLPSPPTHLVSLIDPEVMRLREENESLRTQLELEKLESKGLQLRLSSLEGKFCRLEKLFERLGTTSETDVAPAFFEPTSSTSSSLAAIPGISHLDNSNESSHELVNPFLHNTLDFPLLFDDDNNNASIPTSSADFTSDPLFDSNPSSLTNSINDGFSFEAPIIDGSTLNEAWSNWASSITVDQPVVQEESSATFDLFEFLKREEGQGSEIVC